jgi:hypothetical protein
VGAYSINAQTIEHSILGCPSNRTAPVKKASSQIQIALQLFASTGNILQFYGNVITDIF